MFVKRRVVARLEDMTENEIVAFLGGEPTAEDFQNAARFLARAYPAGSA